MTSVKIINNTISNSESLSALVYSINAISAKEEAIISNNKIDGSYTVGIYCNNNSTISENRISLTDAINAIAINGDSGNNIIQNNFIYGNASNSGIYFVKALFGVTLSTSSSFSINNNEINTESNYGIYCNSTSSCNIVGNRVKNFNKGGIYFNKGNVQSNIADPINLTDLEYMVGCANQNEADTAIVADNIFEKNPPSGSTVQSISAWKAERNTPYYSIIQPPTTPSESASITSTSSTNSYLIQEDGYHVLWYKFNEAPSDNTSVYNSTNKISSQSSVIQFRYSKNLGGETTPQRPNFQSKIFGNQKRLNLYGDCIGMTGSVMDGNYMDVKNFNFSNYGMTIECVFKCNVSSISENRRVRLFEVIGSADRNVSVDFRWGNSNGRQLIPLMGYRGNNSDVATGSTFDIAFGNCIESSEIHHAMICLSPPDEDHAPIVAYFDGKKVIDQSNEFSNFILHYFFKNSNNQLEFPIMKIAVGGTSLEAFSNDNIYLYAGGVSDLRISNTIRNLAYAKKAYEDALALK